MEIEAMNGVSRTPEATTPNVQTGVNKDVPKAEVVQTKPSAGSEPLPRAKDLGKDEQQGLQHGDKEPTITTIDSAVSEANSKLAKTRCEYSYDEATKRVSIKVFDKDSDELIREVPPEETLEMLQKMWELAGLMVDEKR